MCNLTHFIVSTITTEHTCGTYSNFFMENAVLLFSMVEILVFDVYSWFKSVPKDMCTALGNINWPLARGNQKGMSVEKYHHFINKTRVIAGQDRGTNEIFLQNEIILSMPVILPQSTEHIFSEVSLLSAGN